MYGKTKTFMLTFIFLSLTLPFAQAQTSSAPKSASGDLTPELIRETIDRAILFLKASQNSGGGWNEEEPHVGGISSLCTLALLNAGVPTDDPSMVKALNYLRKLDPTTRHVQSTYVTSLQTMVFCQAEPEKDRELIRRNVQWLIRVQKKEGHSAGGWSYPDGAGDPSNSQFAVLALYEAERVGCEIPDITWQNAAGYWRKMQNTDGSWAYLNLPPSLERQIPGTGSITCAGIVSLLIASEKSQPADALIRGETFLPCQRQETDDSKRINHGKRWMTQHFSASRNPGDAKWHLYYLYGLERFGRMTSQRYIGDHDWFREGALQLMLSRRTEALGTHVVTYWKGTAAGDSEGFQTISTSLALLFLSKGRLPILLSKVQFTQDDKNFDWDQHRHDTTNLVTYVESRWKRNLTTQNVKLSAASVEDLLQSPVLYLGGKDSPLPLDGEKQRDYAWKLRDYVDRGGFILAEAVAPGGTFDAGFSQLVKLMFPEDEISMYLMPPEHPVWRAEVVIQEKFLRPVYCVDYACRTCLVYIPMKNNPRPSLSCTWELAGELKRQNRAKHSKDIIREIEAGLNLGLNILAYATDRDLKTKDESFLRGEDEIAQTDVVNRGKLSVANLQHGGGCEAAPTALRNLLLKSADILNSRTGILEETIPITSAKLFDYPVVFMQGRYAFRLTPAEREQLRTYLQRGGVLFANSICASQAFDDSFRREFLDIFPDGKLTAISSDDPVLSSRFGGYDLSSVRVREPQKDAGSVRKTPRETAPKLEGIRLETGRYAVIYSRLDISCALEKHSGECLGYTPEDAAKIGVNVILYALQQ